MTRLTRFFHLAVMTTISTVVLTGCIGDRRLEIMQNAGPEELYQQGALEMAGVISELR